VIRDALEVIQSKGGNPGVFSTSLNQEKDGKRKPEVLQQFFILSLFSSS